MVLATNTPGCRNMYFWLRIIKIPSFLKKHTLTTDIPECRDGHFQLCLHERSLDCWRSGQKQIFYTTAVCRAVQTNAARRAICPPLCSDQCSKVSNLSSPLFRPVQQGEQFVHPFVQSSAARRAICPSLCSEQCSKASNLSIPLFRARRAICPSFCSEQCSKASNLSIPLFRAMQQGEQFVHPFVQTNAARRAICPSLCSDQCSKVSNLSTPLAFCPLIWQLRSQF